MEQIAALNEALCEYHQRTCCHWEQVHFGCHDQVVKPGITSEEVCRDVCCERASKCMHYTWNPMAADPCFHSRYRAGGCADGEYRLMAPGAVAYAKAYREMQCPTPSWELVQRVQDEQFVVGGIESCLDSKEDCEQWAGAGECERNKRFMHKTCPRSCGAEGCVDRHFHCLGWAQMGQCRTNFQYMIEVCPYACRLQREVEEQVAAERQQAMLGAPNRRTELEQAPAADAAPDPNGQWDPAHWEDEDDEEPHKPLRSNPQPQRPSDDEGPATPRVGYEHQAPRYVPGSRSRRVLPPPGLGEVERAAAALSELEGRRLDSLQGDYKSLQAAIEEEYEYEVDWVKLRRIGFFCTLLFVACCAHRFKLERERLDPDNSKNV